ncbi:phosphoribulokinase/uridine kinase family protein [Pelomyxa schiedti]|nr:phosphoribulokinase/uridine kinase family protein [Pelomyxa schiedti]
MIEAYFFPPSDCSCSRGGGGGLYGVLSPPLPSPPPPTPSVTPAPQIGSTIVVCDRCNGTGTLPASSSSSSEGIPTSVAAAAAAIAAAAARDGLTVPSIDDEWKHKAHTHVAISAPSSPDLLHNRDPSTTPPPGDLLPPPSQPAAAAPPRSPGHSPLLSPVPLLPPHTPTPSSASSIVHVHGGGGSIMGHIPHSYADRAFIIGVAGGTASGKTSLCAQILSMLEVYQTRVAIVAQDSFYKTLTEEQHNHVAAHNFDEPAAFDWELMREVLTKLRHKKKTEIPIYDYVTHSRRTDKTVPLFAQDVILFEGILAFHNEGSIDLRSLMDLAIFVETDNDTRLARRVVRDIQERGRQLDNVLYQYEKFVKPAFEEWVEPQKRMADVIIPWGEYSKNNVCVDLTKGEWQTQHYPALDMIVEHIRTKLPCMPTPKRTKKLNRTGNNAPPLTPSEKD